MKTKNKLKLTEEEKDLLESLNKGEWVSELDETKKEKYRKAAAHTLTKDKRINIRMNSRDLKRLKVKAAQEGMQYQTLISSILHKYLSGDLSEN